MIGCLLYLGRRTRPDTLAPVRILARFCNSPTSYCHKAAKRILRYLCGAWSHKSQCAAGSIGVSVFVDSDHAADTITRRSRTAVVLRLGDALCLLGVQNAGIRLVFQRVMPSTMRGPTAHRNRFGLDASLTRLAWTTVVLFRCDLTMRKHIDVRMLFCAGSCGARRA
jgi:hypothetical protein